MYPHADLHACSHQHPSKLYVQSISNLVSPTTGALKTLMSPKTAGLSSRWARAEASCGAPQACAGLAVLPSWCATILATVEGRLWRCFWTDGRRAARGHAWECMLDIVRLNDGDFVAVSLTQQSVFRIDLFGNVKWTSSGVPPAIFVSMGYVHYSEYRPHGVAVLKNGDVAVTSDLDWAAAGEHLVLLDAATGRFKPWPAINTYKNLLSSAQPREIAVSKQTGMMYITGDSGAVSMSEGGGLTKECYWDAEKSSSQEICGAQVAIDDHDNILVKCAIGYIWRLVVFSSERTVHRGGGRFPIHEILLRFMKYPPSFPVKVEKFSSDFGIFQY